MFRLPPRPAKRSLPVRSGFSAPRLAVASPPRKRSAGRSTAGAKPPRRSSNSRQARASALLEREIPTELGGDPFHTALGDDAALLEEYRPLANCVGERDIVCHQKLGLR